ncbi:MAG TPA: DUF1566 domain-containing protein [Geobacteraceae bacterium]
MKRHGLLFIALVLPMLLILPQRSSAGHKRFEVSDETVRDRVTGLIWLRDGGMGPTAAGSPREVKHEINALFGHLNDDGYGDCENWHLPSKEELETLVEYAIDQGYGGDAARGGYTMARLLTEIGFDNVGDAPYWTSSGYRHRGNDYWRLNMSDGRFVEDNGGASRVLPVCFDGPANAEIIDRGKAVFVKHCASCHSSADREARHSHVGGTGTLEASKCKFGKNYGIVVGSIRQGTGNGMPAYGRTLSADDIYAVTFYTLTLRCGRYPGF